MRALAYTIAISLVFALLLRTVWLRSAALSEAYEIRALRERVAEENNINEVLRAQAASRATLRSLTVAAEALDLEIGRVALDVVKLEPAGSPERR